MSCDESSKSRLWSRTKRSIAEEAPMPKNRMMNGSSGPTSRSQYSSSSSRAAGESERDLLLDQNERDLDPLAEKVDRLKAIVENFLVLDTTGGTSALQDGLFQILFRMPEVGDQQISIAIGDEVAAHNRLLRDMDNTADSTKSQMGRAMGRLNDMMSSGGTPMCKLMLFFMVILFVLYFLLR